MFVIKRIGSINGVKLYDIIRSEENITKAVKLACKDHAHDPSVIEIKKNPEPYVKYVKHLLDEGTFHYSKFEEHDIFERGKKRHLCYTRTFPDRIVQHALMNIVAPILHAAIPKDAYAAVKGRGTHMCNRQVHHDLCNDWSHTWYALKIDVHHYFDNIDRDILFNMIKRKIKCRHTLNLLYIIIFDVPGEKGLPIGLFSSQILSVFYLSGLDHYCKELLGAKYYYRYMDDIVILNGNKNVLHACLRYIRGHLSKLHLEIKNNYAVFPIEKRRLDFIGYVFNHKTIMIRKKTKKSFLKICNLIWHKYQKGEDITGHMLMSMRSYAGMIYNWTTDKSLINTHTWVDSLWQI